MGKKISILGAGLVGRTMAIDLGEHHEITSFDISEHNLAILSAKGINTVRTDISDKNALRDAVSDADLVIGSVPGHMGYEMLKNVISEGKNIVDISFFPEDPLTLDELARENNVVAVVDCGVAPGMGNIILGYHDHNMEVKDYRCLVGGLPKERIWPFEYRAVFSPSDVIEEYTRPARYVQNSALVVRPALSDRELVSFPGIGTLEAWNSDGLRSLIDTMSHIPNMIEKTLRYPGTMEYMEVFRAAGLFSEEKIKVGEVEVRPLDVTSAVMFPQWKLDEGEVEFTVMRIDIVGSQAGTEVHYRYDLYDELDPETGHTSMARTTGFTCTAVAELVLNGQYSQIGISPPEYVGRKEADFKAVLNYLKERNVNYQLSMP